MKCSTVKKKVKRRKPSQKCTTTLVSGPVSFTTSPAAMKATLSRDGRVTATGTVQTIAGHTDFVSNNSRTLAAGRYTLTIVRKSARHTETTRESLTIT